VSGFWNGRPVLVTGASGLVGSWLVKELLAADAHVVGLVRDADPQTELFRSRDIERIAVVSGALEDYATVERAINGHEIEAVFHLGAQTIVGTADRNPLATFEANIRGTYNVLEACRVHAGLVRRIVVASSDKAYGTQPLPYHEEMPLLGRHPYDVSKACADLIAKAYHASYGQPVAVARCGNIFGGGDLNWSRVVPGTIRSFLRGERPVVRSDGTFRRDYLYVTDAARAYLCLAEHLDEEPVRGEAFNFSTDKALTVLEMIAEIQRLMDCQGIEPRIQNTAKREIHDQHMSSAKARRMLGWQPQFDLASGLRETIAWYRALLG
jgi:CDP-glucose 4,6-dehydratase